MSSGDCRAKRDRMHSHPQECESVERQFAGSAGLQRDFAGNQTTRQGDLEALERLPSPQLGETKMHCFKRLGERVTARRFEGQVAELQVRVAILNRFNMMGRPCTVHQTRKGNQWYFGMKAHIGVDAQSGWCITWPAPPPMWRMSRWSISYCTARKSTCLATPALLACTSEPNTNRERCAGGLR